ncbi:hypothetical protein N836_03290 [Leptolyngbya sp. Heron Island J]|nr:hypothetical protein N836_03290 [Leptolyngbya sp. Heron Island J]
MQDVDDVGGPAKDSEFFWQAESFITCNFNLIFFAKKI